MAKELHAVQFDGITFGMNVETNTIVYRNFKKQIKREKAIDIYDREVEVLCVPYLFLAAIMQEAHWIVSEKKLFNKFTIDGLGNEEIYVKYTDTLDFRKRK